MEIFLVAITAFIAATLTFFSGFGLGTILTPVFMIFFPADVSIALSAIVHFCNNVFKVVLVGKNADRGVLIRFGIPAILAAVAGSWLLLQLSDLQPLFTYKIAGKEMIVYPVKFLISILLMMFAIIDLLPNFNNLQFSRNKLPLGGILSGFFGGLSGNQGALRSAFLIKAGLSKEAFIGTAVVVSTAVDITRLVVYASRFKWNVIADNSALVIFSVLAAITGAYMGNRLLRKVTLQFVRITVAIMLILISLGLASGLL